MSDEEDKKVPIEDRGSTTSEDVEKNTEPEEEIVEFEFNDDGEEDLKKTLKKLRADLKQAKKEKEEYLTGWQKERADFVNYKKQEEGRKTMFSESVRERILTRFLSVMDSFNMAFANKEAWEKVDSNWRKGVEYIYGQMNSIFDEYGIKPIGEKGEAFDPGLHQSVEVVETDKKEEDHKVAEVIQKGYMIGGDLSRLASDKAGRVIRPARVNVFEFKNGNKNGE